MATALTVWHEEIQQYVPESSKGQRTSALRQICMEFCRDTLLWNEVLLANNNSGDPTYNFSVTDGQNNFDLIDTDETNEDGGGEFLANNSAQIVSIHSVEFKIEKSDGTESDDDQFRFLSPITKESWDNRHYNSNWYYEYTGSWAYRESSTPTGFYIDSNRELFLYPMPSEDSLRGLKVTALLEPIRTATTIPDFIYANYYRLILDGALGYLLRIPGQPWSDIALGDRHRLRYLQQLADAKQIKLRGRTVRSLGVISRPFL